jgi:hypothetical protein
MGTLRNNFYRNVSHFCVTWGQRDNREFIKETIQLKPKTGKIEEEQERARGVSDRD